MHTTCTSNDCGNKLRYPALGLCQQCYNTAWKTGTLPPFPQCGHCGESVEHRRSKYCRKEKCKKESRRQSQRKRDKRRADEKAKDAKPNPTCKNCNDPIGKSYGNYCSKDSCKRAYKRKYRQSHTEEIKALRIAYRAKKRNARVEIVRRDQILARDKWTCGICSKKIPRTAQYPHPLSPSLDHINPLATGGEHSYANMQASHLVCNSRKGARGEPQQLALI